jgi:ABC-type lipoprotein release transport system permease subunit
MYKLTLCLKYLVKRALAYFAMVGVALCVFMMLVSVSVLNGFVNKIERAAKGLFGDIVVSSAGLSGIGYYDRFVPMVAGGPLRLETNLAPVPAQGGNPAPRFRGRPSAVDIWALRYASGSSESKELSFPGTAALRRPTGEAAQVAGRFRLLVGDELVFEPSGLAAADRKGLMDGKLALRDFRPRLTGAVPEVEAGSPFILTFGILRVGPEYRRTVQIAGIRLPERADVSDFEDGLFVQAGEKRPTFDPPMVLVEKRLAAELARTLAILERERQAAGAEAAPTPEKKLLLERLSNAIGYQDNGLYYVQQAGKNRAELESLRRRLRAAEQAGNVDEVDRLEALVEAKQKKALHAPDYRAILGLGIPGLSFRTPRGETVRVIGPGQKVVLSLLPLGRKTSPTDITPNTRTFTVIDDCSTDVASIDSEIVYLPFETLQLLNNMSAETSADDANEVVVPARCSQIHIKVKDGLADRRRLREIGRKVERVWADFRQRHRNAATTSVYVETWRQRQSKLVSSIEAQRTLMVIILGIISLVAVLLIFVIFYVIVVQKTRDIGVLKAVGAPSGGVAAIFLSYGAAIGLVGSILGTIGGCFFVWNINPIHDWIGRTFGFVVWNRETFMFEKIPNEVGSDTVVTIVIASVLSGVLGSLIPAALAATKQPVEALRYE